MIWITSLTLCTYANICLDPSTGDEYDTVKGSFEVAQKFIRLKLSVLMKVRTFVNCLYYFRLHI